MSEPVRLYNAAGECFDCVAPSEVKRLLESGEWRREPWPEPVVPTPAVQPKPPAKPKTKARRPLL